MLALLINLNIVPSVGAVLVVLVAIITSVVLVDDSWCSAPYTVHRKLRDVEILCLTLKANAALSPKPLTGRLSLTSHSSFQEISCEPWYGPLASLRGSEV